MSIHIKPIHEEYSRYAVSADVYYIQGDPVVVHVGPDRVEIMSDIFLRPMRGAHAEMLAELLTVASELANEWLVVEEGTDDNEG